MKLASFISTVDPKWMNLLKETPHEFYHLPKYLELDANINTAKPLAFYYQNAELKVLIPIYIRNLPYGGINQFKYDARSPYGYPGILSNELLTLENLTTVLKELKLESKKEGILTYFLKLNPFTNKDLNIKSNNFLKFINHGTVAYIDLNKDEESLNSQLSKNHKRNIKKLTKSGFYAKVNEWNDYNKFQKIYIETMQRHQASNYYLFDSKYFANLKDIMEDTLVLCTIYNELDEVVSGGIFSNNGRIAQYHLGGTSYDYLKVAPSKLMFYHMTSYFKSSRVDILNLGGGLQSRDDNLLKFKLGFTNDIESFCSLSVNCDNESYMKLNEKVILNQGLKYEDYQNDEFFPLYRKLT